MEEFEVKEEENDTFQISNYGYNGPDFIEMLI